jgi:hypothetical protein
MERHAAQQIAEGDTENQRRRQAPPARKISAASATLMAMYRPEKPAA